MGLENKSSNSLAVKTQNCACLVRRDVKIGCTATKSTNNASKSQTSATKRDLDHVLFVCQRLTFCRFCTFKQPAALVFQNPAGLCVHCTCSSRVLEHQTKTKSKSATFLEDAESRLSTKFDPREAFRWQLELCLFCSELV